MTKANVNLTAFSTHQICQHFRIHCFSMKQRCDYILYTLLSSKQSAIPFAIGWSIR